MLSTLGSSSSIHTNYDNTAARASFLQTGQWVKDREKSLENLVNKASLFREWDHHIMDRDIVQARQKLMSAAR